MKYEVVSCSTAGGTEVIGVVEAENEAVAGQLANERYHPVMDSEDVYVRPLREVKKAEPAPVVTTKPPDFYHFKVEKDGWNSYSENDHISVEFDRSLLLRTLNELLQEGMGKERDTFSMHLTGKLSHSEI